MTRSLARIAAFATLAFSLAACGSDSATSPTSVSVNGTYTLQTVNGKPLPFTFDSLDVANKVQIESDIFTFSQNGTFSERGTIRWTESGIVSTDNFNYSGSYTKNGTALTLRYTDDSRSSGTIDGDRLTLVAENLSFVYVRQ